MSRPEHTAPPEIFYNEAEAAKYTSNSRMIGIQTQLAERCLQLLALPEDSEDMLLLDIGCGSGLSGEVITEAGLSWMGLDISPAMLAIAAQRELEGSCIQWDMGHGIPFRGATFDGAISVSALQWLCNADFTGANPYKRLNTFFSSLYHTLKRGAKAVLQWYPENAQQMEMITASAMRCGFTGGMVVDFPNSTKAKKYFLVLMTGRPSALPRAVGEDVLSCSSGTVGVGGRAREDRRHKSQGGVSKRDWILHKKERARAQGKEGVKADTKYTGRKRPRF